MILSVCGATVTLVGAWALGVYVTRRTVGHAASLAAGAALLSVILFVAMATLSAQTLGYLAPVMLLAAIPLRPRLALPDVPRWLWLVLVPFGVYALVHALTPETQADPNVYHLLPAIDAQTHGGFSRLVGFYERLPHALELLFIPAFELGGSSAARLVHLAFFFATLPVIAALGERFGLTRTAGWTAAGLYAVSPVVLATAASAYNDAALTFASATAILVLATGGPAWIAGLIAGFCFGIKMTGGIVAVLGVGWLLWQRRWRDAVLFIVAAAVPAAPWVLRNLIQIHNPFAPFGNRLFPNPLFHISTEQMLMAALSNYGISFWQRFPEVVWGWRLQGMIGPAFALAPLGFLALRTNRRAAPLLLFAAVLSIPWWLNAGARFLMPAVPFLALAIVAVLPARLAPAVLAVQAILCWPQVLDHIQPNSTHLFGFPIRAALGHDPDFLDRTNWDYRYAKLVEQHTDRHDRVLDLYGLHRAHIVFGQPDIVGWWQSAWPENAAMTLEFARQPGEAKLFEVRAGFEPQLVRGVRIRPAEPSPASWSIVEVEPRLGRDPVPPSAKWALSAKPNRWETPLAFDGNLATRWQSWQATEPRQWLAADFVEPIRIDSVRVVSTHWDGGNRRFDIDIQLPDGRWTAAATQTQELGPLDLRAQALAYAKRAGFTHIIGRVGDRDMNLLVRSLAQSPGVKLRGELNDFVVLQIR